MSPKLLLASLCVVSSLAAQPTVPFLLPVPTPVTTTNLSFPFGSARLHYQTWYSLTQMNSAIGQPARLTGVSFLTSNLGQTGRLLQFDLRLANGIPGGASSVFQSNLVSGETLVFSSRPPNPPFQSPNTVAGQYTLNIPFTTPFVWDGQSGLVIDVRLYDNGNGDVPFPYDISIDPFAFGRGAILYTLGNPDAANATTFLDRSPLVQFTWEQGVTAPFGSGCAGQQFIVPQGTTSGGEPIAGNTLWKHHLTQAAAQQPAIWLFGASNTDWFGLALPHELVEVSALGCDLLVSADLVGHLTTGGSGVGGGIINLNTPVPPITSIVGQSYYTQWLVLDPLAANGVMSATAGLWHVFGQ